jgi:hypothetical protein
VSNNEQCRAVKYLVRRGFGSIAPSGKALRKVRIQHLPHSRSPLYKGVRVSPVARVGHLSVTQPRAVDCPPHAVLTVRHWVPVRLEYESRILMAQHLGKRDHGLASVEQHTREVVP